LSTWWSCQATRIPESCYFEDEGIANLSTDRDYNYPSEHVNANRFPPFAVTRLLTRSSCPPALTVRPDRFFRRSPKTTDTSQTSWTALFPALSPFPCLYRHASLASLRFFAQIAK
jgi:hypothetical protein